MKKKSKIKVPAYSVGLSQALDASSILGTTLQATGNNTAGDIGGLLGSAGSMAGTGMAIGGGPVGAAIGGGLGLVTGALGLINKNKQKKRAERRQRNILNQQYADATTSAMMEDYYGENQLANTFAMGGVMPQNLAYVDNGELIKTPDGTIKEVTAGSSNVTDDVLTHLPVGSKILSDKLTVPGTNKTFAQMGRGLQKRSAGKDMFAKNAAELNARNFDKLLAYQENIKAVQGIKPGKKAVSSYADGGVTDYNNLATDLLGTKKVNKVGIPALYAIDSSYITNPLQRKAEANIENGFNSLSEQQISDGLFKNPQAKSDFLARPSVFNPASGTTDALGAYQLHPSKGIPTLKTSLVPKTNLDTLSKTLISGNPDRVRQDILNRNGEKKRLFDYTSLASFAPALYNLGQSFAKPEVESVTPNPYLGNVNKLMAGRRMNVTPMLNANRRSRAIGNYNLSQVNTNTGAGLAARIQNAVNDYTTTADIYANAQNANNSYAGEYAQMLGNLGNQYVSNKMVIDDINAKNRAARRNFGSAAMSQIGEGAQMQQLMKNQARMGELSMSALIPFLQQGFTTKQINDLKRTYYGN